MATRIDDLYEADYYAWTKEQAKALRALAKDRWSGPLDLTRLALEVEDLGKEQRNALRSWATRIIEHLLKLEYSPTIEPRRGWVRDILQFHREIRDRLTPTLRRDLTNRLPRLYRAAREDMERERRLFGEGVEAGRLPEVCPYTLEQVLDADWWPESRRMSSDSMPVARITATYENVDACCPFCNYRNVYNRRDDLRTFEPIAGLNVRCNNNSCNKNFRIVSDSVNPAYQQLLSECHELICNKKYMSAGLLICQSYEMFFALFLRVKFVYQPFSAERDVDALNAMYHNVASKTERLTFEKLRQLFLYCITGSIEIKRFDDAKRFLDKALECYKNFPNDKNKAEVKIDSLLDTYRDGVLIDHLKKMVSADINKLRNKIIHKERYRPSLEEIKEHHDFARKTLPALGFILDLYDDPNWYTRTKS